MSNIEHTTTHTEAHSAPHIPDVKGEAIPGMQITNTVLSTWIFMVVLFVMVGFFHLAMRTKLFPRIKTFGLDIVSRLDAFLNENIAHKNYARAAFPLVAGFFVFILLGNFFGLILDIFAIIFPSLHHYIRPFNSDLATTLSMAIVVILVAQLAGMTVKGPIKHWKQYLFNFSGHNIIEKVVNVPVGWIHLLGELTRVLSLSVRLFANIFAGVALIGIMVFLGKMIPAGPLGGIIVLPVWFFEILVACIQAFIFAILSALYINEAVTDHGH